MSLSNLPQESNKKSLRNSKGQTAKTHCLPNTALLSRSLGNVPMGLRLRGAFFGPSGET